MKTIAAPSPNFDSRDGQPIDMLILHYTGMKTGQEALDRLRNPAAKVSAHYMIEEDGRAFSLVPEEMRAWHAGISSWRGASNINQRSIGIEIVNPGHEFGYRPFPKTQMDAVAELCKSVLARHPIPRWNVIADPDIAPTRKTDPGELFDWRGLASQHIGLWPNPSTQTAPAAALATYGYDTSDLPAAILAFQRHFSPESLTGEWNPHCASLLQALLDSAR